MQDRGRDAKKGKGCKEEGRPMKVGRTGYGGQCRNEAAEQDGQSRGWNVHCWMEEWYVWGPIVVRSSGIDSQKWQEKPVAGKKKRRKVAKDRRKEYRS